MLEHDPLATEFAALRTAVLTRPPGPAAARRTVRRRRHRAILATTSLVVFAIAALGIALAGYAATPRPMPTAQPPLQGTSGTRATGVPFINPPPAASASPRANQGGGGPTAATTTDAPCTKHGAVILDTPHPTSVSVRVDQRGPYPLCPNEKVRVFAATYSVDGSGVQHLYKSSTGTVDLAHNPLTLPLQLPPCHVIVYVMSGSATIKQTIPATSNLYEDGPLVYGNPAYGPYNGVVWISDQNPCGGSR
jgi:hypothetical protein